MSTLHSLIHALAQANGAFLAVFTAASIAFLTLALIVDLLATRVAAAHRHLLITTALVAPAVLFAAGAIGFGGPSVAAAPELGVDVVTTIAAAQPVRPNELLCAIVALWLVGTLIAIVRAVMDLMRWRGIVSRAETDPRYRVIGGAVALSTEIAAPMVAGFFEPRILLPARELVERLSAEELETVFAHELEHVKRRDNVVAFAAQLASALFWFDPIHRLARRRAAELRERACDEAVLEQGCAAEPYLAALAKSCQNAVHTPAVACMSRIRFRERMESIMSYDRTRLLRLPEWLVRVSALAMLGAAAIAFALVAPQPMFALEDRKVVDRERDAIYELNVQARRGPDRRMTVIVNVRTPDGHFSNVFEFPNLPDTGTITTGTGGRAYKTVVTMNADGTGTAALEVLEGNSVLARRDQTFAVVVPIDRPLPAGYERVGGAVKAPVVVSRVEPLYPAEAKSNRISGIVILETLIDEQGTVTNVNVLKPLPYGLDQAAVDAIKQWRFVPGTLDGRPVPVVFNLTMNFRLKGDEQ